MGSGRPKGGKNKKWTLEEKLRIVKRYMDDKIGQYALANEEHISKGMLANWIKKYLKDGSDGLKNKKKCGNKFAALSRRKDLPEVERLKLIVMKQEIEIERLKKGYFVEGVGANKEYVTSKDVSLK